MNSPFATEQPQTTKTLWNFNFTMLWFGQLISVIGDSVYGIALGFWVLQKLARLL
jgi:hypothetical protein